MAHPCSFGKVLSAGSLPELLADRKSPDYRNSIKESISAVEAICKLITGSQKATLEDALRQLETKLGSVHPALKDAFRKNICVYR